MEVNFNGQIQNIESIERLGLALDEFHKCEQFELVCSASAGPSLFMLRNRDLAWLMYLRHEGDSGYHSQGDLTQNASATFQLSNGQRDEYPISWCIEVEQCYKAVAYFFVNGGQRPGWVQWSES